jgi:hypothetical protein
MYSKTTQKPPRAQGPPPRIGATRRATVISCQVQQLIFKSDLAGVPKNRIQAKLVLVSMAHFADNAGANAPPAVATVAKLASSSVRTDQALLKALVTADLLEQRAPATQHRPKTYRKGGRDYLVCILLRRAICLHPNRRNPALQPKALHPNRRNPALQPKKPAPQPKNGCTSTERRLHFNRKRNSIRSIKSLRIERSRPQLADAQHS